MTALRSACSLVSISSSFLGCCRTNCVISLSVMSATNVAPHPFSYFQPTTYSRICTADLPHFFGNPPWDQTSHVYDELHSPPIGRV